MSAITTCKLCDRLRIAVACLTIVALGTTPVPAQNLAAVSDPGIRRSPLFPPDAGEPLFLINFNPPELSAWIDGGILFGEVFSVTGKIAGEQGVGLGPAFNGNSCQMCHSSPA